MNQQNMNSRSINGSSAPSSTLAAKSASSSSSSDPSTSTKPRKSKKRTLVSESPMGDLKFPFEILAEAADGMAAHVQSTLTSIICIGVRACTL